MRREALYNLERKNNHCPVLLKEMLGALKQKKLELNRHLKYFIRGQEVQVAANNVFTLKCKESPSIKFELKTYR